ncbi:MAG: hypothetical protein ACXW6T_08210 [Candidatus Binatia bacterium]
MASPARSIVKALLYFSAAVVSGLAGLYFWVQSDSFHRWLENEISARTGYAVHAEKLTLSLPLRLVASGVTAAKDGKRILTATRLTATVTPLDILAQTIQRIHVEAPVLQIDLAELLKSKTKSETTVALRNLRVTNGRAVIKTEDGSPIEIPAIDLDAQNINLGSETGMVLRADVPQLNGIADFAVKWQANQVALTATVNAKSPKGLFRRSNAAAKPILQAEAALQAPAGKDPNVTVDVRFNQLKLGTKELSGQLKASAALDKTFAAGSFTSQLDLNGFPNSISPVALQISDAPAAANANGEFSVTKKSIAIKSLTLRSQLGNAEAAGNLAFTPIGSINDGHIVARNLDWENVKKFMPAPFNQWNYRGQAELEMKLQGPWRALQIDGNARSDAAQVRAANFALASFTLRAPFRWANGQLAIQNGRVDGKKFSFAGSDQLKSTVEEAEIGAIGYDPKKPGLITAQVNLTGGQFAAADSSKVGEGLAVNGSVELAAHADSNTTAMVASLNLTAGELLWGKFFGDLKFQKPALTIDAEYSRDNDRLQCRRCDLTLATVGQVSLSGSVEQITGTPQLRLQARSDNLSPAGFFEFFLRETFHREYPLLDKLTVSGQMAMQLQVDGPLEQLAASGNLALKNGEVAAKSNDWQLAAINLQLPFQISLSDRPAQNAAIPALGLLSIGRARFGNQQLAPMTTTVALANNALRLHQSLRIAVFGGEVELRNVSWPDIIRDPKAVTFSADAKRLQLQDLTEAFDWPRFSGQLNGAIPEVESAGNTLRTRGEIQAEIFGGRVRLSKLEIDNPFSALASVKMSVKLESIELEQLSKTFAFGRISGILEGSVDDLVITDGQPSQLRADLHSVERSGVDQRISVDALNKITVLSSGQEAGSLYGGLASLFDSFRYSKLGFKASLRNDRLTLQGVESQGGKELLVVGSLLPPTVNIVSHTQTIAFSELVRRLERIKSDKPEVK